MAGAGSTKEVATAGSTDIGWTTFGSNRLSHVVAAFAPATIYSSSGDLTSVSITPSSLKNWDAFAWQDTEPANTDIEYQVEYFNGGTWQLLPDSALPGNAAGFDNSPVDLLGLDVTYNQVRLKATLSTSDTAITPALHEWHITWNDWSDGVVAWDKIGASTDVVVAGSDVELATGSNTSTYDFSTATAGTTKWGYICADANGFSTGTFSPGTETEFSSAQYTSVSAPEETDYVQTDTSNAKTHRFTFRISEAEGTVSQIYAQVKVMSEDPDSHRLYIWNYTTTDWELLDSSTTQDTWEILEGTKSTGVGDYIDDATGDVSVLFYIIDPGFFGRWMRTDYVKVEITYTEYQTSGNLTSTSPPNDLLNTS